mmetsp:Transcript_27782/g.109002  ORF Transcript_27782/g.109002 Transcript_27782/m.109002 type:complete len:80 (-) Transcript_27782:6-245(-)
MYCLAMLLKNRSERRARSATCFYAGQLEISPVILFLDSLDSHRYFLLVFFLGLKNLFSSFLNLVSGVDSKSFGRENISV